MKKRMILGGLAAAMVVGMVSLLAFAGNDENGNGFPAGAHYEFGLIGRPTTYEGSGTDDSNRHNMFIPLYNDGMVDGPVKILMTQGDGFLVVDGDATDGQGELQIGPGYYAVFARALGKPGKPGNERIISIDAWFTYWMDEEGGTLSDAVWMGNVDLSREKGKPETKNISKLFYFSGTITYLEWDEDSGTWVEVTETFNNEWVFDIPLLEDYWWNVDNNGVKRLEIRFYPVPAGYQPPPLDGNGS